MTVIIAVILTLMTVLLILSIGCANEVLKENKKLKIEVKKWKNELQEWKSNQEKKQIHTMTMLMKKMYKDKD